MIDSCDSFRKKRWFESKAWEHLYLTTLRIPTPSRVANFRTRTPAIQIQTLPLEGPRILRVGGFEPPTFRTKRSVKWSNLPPKIMGDSENKMRSENYPLAEMEKGATSYGAAKLIEQHVHQISQTLMTRGVCFSTCQSPFQTIKVPKRFVTHLWVVPNTLRCLSPNSLGCLSI